MLVATVAQLAFGALPVANGRSDLALASSTVGVAALFGPVRRRLQVAGDRRVYRRRYAALRTLAQLDPGALAHAICGVVDKTVEPTHVLLETVPGRTA